MLILPPTFRIERRLMKKIAQKTQDKTYAIRVMAVLALYRGESVSVVAKEFCIAQSSVWRWIKRFRTYGWIGLKSQPAGRHRQWDLAPLLPFILHLLEISPQQLDYVRSRWSLELFIIQINKIINMKFSISTLYRFLHKNKIVWRRVAPTVHKPDPNYEEKMARINQALSQASEENPVFYEDEVDINFNPKIGSDWYFKGQQKRLITPGKNQKYYFAGCFNIQTREIVYTGYNRKNSQLLIKMLEKLKHHYRHAKTLTVILDNYSIHTSKQVKAWLELNPTVTLLFLPIYSPWLNKIERLWQSLHETVTRNHYCQYMWQLIKKVKIFLNAASATTWKGIGNMKLS
ncbi:IS630 family transposase [Xenorhabdus griffiniae]|uniref:IS630 family transposase n=2 Tax=Xenorhabdus griffiniae TaxID=351672 RepID=A0ABY9XCS4_9GAMM|nr:IS630 family transposase [Xenorhabdus griffiniae]WMV70710.1 IS630 family transposase [Xenorhabdus griffiniae]WNH00387.1 IS630 family transposase [Xenorhabdus griffiniae]